MSPLGTAMLNAMRDQGWLVVIDDTGEETLVFTRSAQMTFSLVPFVLFQEEDDERLRYVLLVYIVDHGLLWPWPPDHRDEVHGEVPRSE